MPPRASVQCGDELDDNDSHAGGHSARPGARAAAPRRNHHRPDRPGAWHLAFPPSAAAAAVPGLHPRLRAELFGAGPAGDGLLRDLRRGPGAVRLPGRPGGRPAGAVRRTDQLPAGFAGGLAGAGLRRIDAGRRAGRPGQRAFSSGRLHHPEPAGLAAAAWACLLGAWHQRQSGLGAGAGLPDRPERRLRQLACGLSGLGAGGCRGAGGAVAAARRSG